MIRPLVHYFLIGGLLYAGQVVFDIGRGDPPQVVVAVPETATEAEVDRAIEREILLSEARRYGWYRTDPIVFNHLVRNMRFIEPNSSLGDAALFARALEMNMQEHDPVVRARLLYRARQALEFVPEDEMPTREELETHLADHPDRFERQGKVTFHHVFLSGTKRGEALGEDAAALRAELDARGPEPPSGLGDPLPGVRAEQTATTSAIEATYGTALADAVEESVDQELDGVWRGPVPSVYGMHFVRVVDASPVTVPELAVIEAEVRENLLREVRAELAVDRLAALRDAYVVQLERTR